MVSDAILVVSPEHSRIFGEAGWDKQKLRDAIQTYSMTSGEEVVRGAQDIAEGMPEQFKNATLPKFKPDGLHIVRAGGNAGLFSAVIGGWVASGPMGSSAVTVPIQEK